LLERRGLITWTIFGSLIHKINDPIETKPHTTTHKVHYVEESNLYLMWYEHLFQWKCYFSMPKSSQIQRSLMKICLCISRSEFLWDSKIYTPLWNLGRLSNMSIAKKFTGGRGDESPSNILLGKSNLYLWQVYHN